MQEPVQALDLQTGGNIINADIPFKPLTWEQMVIEADLQLTGHLHEMGYSAKGTDGIPNFYNEHTDPTFRAQILRTMAATGHALYFDSEVDPFDSSKIVQVAVEVKFLDDGDYFEGNSDRRLKMTGGTKDVQNTRTEL